MFSQRTPLKRRFKEISNKSLTNLNIAEFRPLKILTGERDTFPTFANRFTYEAFKNPLGLRFIHMILRKTQDISVITRFYYSYLNVCSVYQWLFSVPCPLSSHLRSCNSSDILGQKFQKQKKEKRRCRYLCYSDFNTSFEHFFNHIFIQFTHSYSPLFLPSKSVLVLSQTFQKSLQKFFRVFSKQDLKNTK